MMMSHSTATLAIHSRDHPDSIALQAIIAHSTGTASSSSSSSGGGGSSACVVRVVHEEEEEESGSVMTLRRTGEGTDVSNAPLAIARWCVSALQDPSGLMSGLTVLEQAKVCEWVTFARVDLAHAPRRDVLLRVADRWLAGRTFAAAPHRITVADFFLLAHLRQDMRRVAEAGTELSFPHLCRYYSHVQHAVIHHSDDMQSLLGQPVQLFSERTMAKRPAFRFVPRAAKQMADQKKKKGGGGSDNKKSKDTAAAPGENKDGGGGGGKQQQKKSKDKKNKKADQTASSGATAGVPVPISALELRAGKILSAKRHPDADGLYVEEIDVGEDKPRTVCSGLVGKVAMEDKVGAMVLVATNLKPTKMRGIMSQAMVLAATSADGSTVELVSIPEGVSPGERVAVDNFPGEPDKQLNSKRLVKILPLLRTTEATGEVVFADDKNVLRFPSCGKAAYSSLKGAEVK